MKKIICYWDESSGEVRLTDSLDGYLIGSIIQPLTTQPEEVKSDVLEYVKAGMSAEDLIKLKHGGVI